ncbi:MAG: glycoside hydrolase family 3 N-terminal domain-containing protein [Arcanobacterium sp.]|nr:glycoside hydrolase family 3 N-terminal domain-containing protein [Arcanobacterium sp.]
MKTLSDRHDLDPDILGVLMLPIPAEGLTDAVMPYLIHAGAVCLFSPNTTGGIAATRRLVEQIRALNPDVIVASDEEGGDVTRIEAAHGSALPNAALVTDAYQTGRYLGELCASAGVDLDLAPVADVLTERTNAVISVRSFGSDSSDVIHKCRDLIRGLHSIGRTTCLKHYPGHGASASDSHIDGVEVSLSKADYLHHHVRVFHELCNDTDAIMMGHLAVPALGSGVASVSAWSYSLVRSCGFRGPIITDALDMAGAGASTDDRLSNLAFRSYQAIVAGADLLCLGSPKHAWQLMREGYIGVATALDDGAISRADLQARRARNQQLRGSYSGSHARDDYACDSHDRNAHSHSAHSHDGFSGEPQPQYDRNSALAFGASEVRKSVWTRGETTLNSPWGLVDAREVPEYSAAFLAPAIVHSAKVMGGRYLGAASSASLAELEQSGERLCVLTKFPSAPAEHAAIQRVLSVRPDALFIHLGTASSVPPVEHLICLQGTSAAHAQVLQELIRPATVLSTDSAHAPHCVQTPKHVSSLSAAEPWQTGPQQPQPQQTAQPPQGEPSQAELLQSARSPRGGR